MQVNLADSNILSRNASFHKELNLQTCNVKFDKFFFYEKDGCLEQYQKIFPGISPVEIHGKKIPRSPVVAP